MLAETLAKWTDDEKNALRKGREGGLTVPEIANQLGRPVSAAYTQARKIGAIIMTRKVWTAAEDAILRDAVARGASMTEAGRLLDRSPESARWRKTQLGLKGPAPKRCSKPRPESQPKARPSVDVATLRRLALTSTAAMAAKQMGHGAAVIRSVAKAEGITFVAEVDEGREQSLAALRKAWGETQDLSELAVRCGKSKTWVRGATLDLGLREKRVRKDPADADAREEIRALAKRNSITEVAKKLGRDVRTIRQIADEDGIEFVIPSRKGKKKPVPNPVAKRPVAATRSRPARTRAPRQVPPLSPAALAARLMLIREVATRMRLEGRLPPME